MRSEKEIVQALLEGKQVSPEEMKIFRKAQTHRDIQKLLKALIGLVLWIMVSGLALTWGWNAILVSLVAGITPMSLGQGLCLAFVVRIMTV